MKRNLIVLAVMLSFAANEAEARAKRARVRMRDARETFWKKYDHVVNLVMDELEARKIIKDEEF